MAIPKNDFSNYIKSFDFRTLFNELGWDRDIFKQTIPYNNINYNLTSVAEKSGFRIIICDTQPGMKIPTYSIRKKIENVISKLFLEHIIIFIDESREKQIWQFTIRKAGFPVKTNEIAYFTHQDPELLYQKTGSLFFTLDEEENITIVDVVSRVTDNFRQNAEKVTKKFYERFKREHSAFQSFIVGLEDKFTLDWYTSLMLNRLMFCYFIQKKGFLDDNRNYLRDKLAECRKLKGTNNFYSFYRSFLLALFHKRLGAPENSRENLPDCPVKLGNIPYLNGGIFDIHKIEKKYHNINIKDEAFAKIFAFFDEYEWHLDTRPDATGKEINPDVIGYIFEKYINERSKMGAYYTKEDITEYIGKNCIIPWLFDEVKRNHSAPFTKNGRLWEMLRESDDKYIYDAVKYGIPDSEDIFSDIPDEIKQGFNPELERKVVDGTTPYLWEIRKPWNNNAPSEIALPTETYRELIERRKRYQSIKTKIETGEITQTNDFITYNLNIRQFAQDTIQNSDDPVFIRHFYKALSKVTILDPTCGSGAFLFAAMNILEPLYEACIERMENFVLDSGKGKHTFFEDTLKVINAPEHPNRQYFIYKSIILNNLYGVDIMKEAVEIAKLRLFLKLVSTVDVDHIRPNYGLEPLPDIDFNIRSGNTLIGYATEEELDEAFAGKLDLDEDLPNIKINCDKVGKTFNRYKQIQLEGNDYDLLNIKEAKDELSSRLLELRNELNSLLHKHHYGNHKDYSKWLTTHQPFHWFAEFYEIINERKGFDVIIGNPPYVEFSKVRNEYSIIDYQTEKCGNLYAYVMERAIEILKLDGRLSVIVPLASFSTIRMKPLQQLYVSHCDRVFISNYEATSNPSTLFVGVKIQLSIIICSKRKPTNPDKQLYSTAYIRCYSNERPFLFEKTYYTIPSVIEDYITRFGSSTDATIINKLTQREPLALCIRAGSNLFFRNMGNFFYKLAFPYEPKYYRNQVLVSSSTVSSMSIGAERRVNVVIATINSTLFYYFWIQFSDCYHLSKKDIGSLPLSIDQLERKFGDILLTLSQKYIESIESDAIWQAEEKRDGTLKRYRRYFPQNSKYISDQIDSILAQHYGFTQEELDFIINYDYKYRMGNTSKTESEQQSWADTND